MTYTDIYHFYTNHILEKGAPPTLDQIGKHFRFTREYARQALDKMEKEGYIFRLKRSSVFWCFNVERFTSKDL